MRDIFDDLSPEASADPAGAFDIFDEVLPENFDTLPAQPDLGARRNVVGITTPQDRAQVQQSLATAGQEAQAIAEGALPRLGGAYLRGIAGAKTAAGDIGTALGIDNTLAAKAKEDLEGIDLGMQQIEQEHPVNTQVGKWVQGAVDSSLLTAPAMVAAPLALGVRGLSAGAGGLSSLASKEALVAGMKTLSTISAGLLGSQVGLENYGEKRAAGISKFNAAADSIVKGAAEIIGEKLGTDLFIKAVAGGKDEFAKNLVVAMGGELFGENATTVAQTVSDLIFDDAGTLTDRGRKVVGYMAGETVANSQGQQHDLLTELRDTSAQTAIQVAGMGLLSKGMSLGVGAVAGRPRGVQPGAVPPAGPAPPVDPGGAPAVEPEPLAQAGGDVFDQLDQQGLTADLPEPTGPVTPVGGEMSTVDLPAPDGPLSKAVQAGPVAGVDPVQVAAFADRVAAGERSWSGDDLQFYLNNTGEIEQELQRRQPAGAPSASSVQQTIEQGGIANDLPEVRQEAGGTQEVPSVRGEAVTSAPQISTAVDVAAHEAAASPVNARPEPSPAQIQAGNYKKGHVRLAGLDLSIENPAGSTRKGTDENGRAWSTDLQHHYGYIKGSVGKDKDHIDVFVKPGVDPNTVGDTVYVVNQKNLKTGAFDEHKVLLGFGSREEAEAAYLSNYDESGPGRILSMGEATADNFRQWLTSGNTKQPFVQGARANAPTTADSKQPNYLHLKKQAKDLGLSLSKKLPNGNFEISENFSVVHTARSLQAVATYFDAAATKNRRPAAGAVETHGLPAESVEYINGKVAGLGSVARVGEVYSTDSAVDRYAREQAARHFKKEAEATPAPPLTVADFNRLINESKRKVKDIVLLAERRAQDRWRLAIPDATRRFPSRTSNKDRQLREQFVKEELTKRQGQIDKLNNKIASYERQRDALQGKVAPSPVAGEENFIFTAERAERARQILRQKLSQLNAGIDPEILQAGIDLAGYHIERGARSFAAYSKKMVEEMGEAIKPFLHSFYAAVRHYPGFDNAGMESDDAITIQLEVAKGQAATEKKSPVKKSSGKNESRALQGDYGVKSIDAYTAAGELAKENFRKDTLGYLKALAGIFQQQGWEVEKPRFNPGGLAGSGDGSLIVFKPESDYGAYVTIGGGVSFGFNSASPSGVTIMYRATTRKSKYTGLVNRWDVPWDITTAELAGKLIAEVELQESAEQRKAQAEPAAAPVAPEIETEPVPEPVEMVVEDEVGGYTFPDQRQVVTNEDIPNLLPVDYLEKVRASYDLPETIEIDTPERDVKRKEWGEKLYKGGASNQARRVDLVLGLAASGKSSVAKPLASRYGSLLLDSDDAKEMIDEFDNGNGANAVHEESSLIFERTLDQAIKAGDNLVLPLVGGKLQSLVARIDKLSGAGYEIHLHFIDLPMEKSIGRLYNRYLEDKRLMDPELITSNGLKPFENFVIVEAKGGIENGYLEAQQGRSSGGQEKRAAVWVGGVDGLGGLPRDDDHRGRAQGDEGEVSGDAGRRVGARGLSRQQEAGALYRVDSSAFYDNDVPRDTQPNVIYSIENTTPISGAFFQQRVRARVLGSEVLKPHNLTGGNPDFLIQEWITGEAQQAAADLLMRHGVSAVSPAYDAFMANVPTFAADLLKAVKGENDATVTAPAQGDDQGVPAAPGTADVSGALEEAHIVDVPGRSRGADGTVVSRSLRGSEDGALGQGSESAGAAGPALPGAAAAVGTDAGGVSGLPGSTGRKGRGDRGQSGDTEAPARSEGEVYAGEQPAGEGHDGRLLGYGREADRPEQHPGRDGAGLPAGLIKKDVQDLRIAPGGLERSGSWKETAKRNLDVIELIRTLESENRFATPDEQQLLVKYVGWGASEVRNKLFPGYASYGRIQANWADDQWRPLVDRLVDLLSADDIKTAARSSQYAHYTSEAITRSIWSALQRMGFVGGKVFEPGMGTGNFMGTMPDSLYATSRYTGIEFDNLTAAIAKQLYPAQNIIHGDYTRQKFPANFFDVAIGNPPFAKTKILVDPEYKRYGFSLHDYFFAKTIDRVRPGGLLVFVTSRYTMDKQGDKARKYLADRADLIGAVRLPQTAFKQHSGTEVVTDVIFLRKRQDGEAQGGEAWMGLDEVKAGDETLLINEYFARHPEMVHGVHSTQGSMYSKNEYTVTPLDGDIEQHFAAAIEKLPANVYSVMQQPAAQIKAEVVERDFNPKNKKEGGIYLSDKGVLMRVEFGSGVPLSSMVKLSSKEEAWLKDYVELRDLMKQARFDQFHDGPWEKSLKKLNKAYAEFVARHGMINDYIIRERKETNEDDQEITVEYRRYKWEKLINRDVEGPLVWSIEKVTEDGDIVKGAFLKGRTIAKPERKEPQTMPEALALSLDETGHLDLGHIAGMMGVSERDVVDSLGDLVFETPEGKFELADQYLSGDVVAKLAEAETAAISEEKYRRNVKALQDVQPKPLGPGDVSARLGMAWIPLETVEEFASSVLEVNVNVTRHAATNSWKVDLSNEATRSWSRRRSSSKGPGTQSLRSDAAEWGTAERGANEILEAVLNQRPLSITAKDADGKQYTDQAKTAKVNDVAEKMKVAFKSWVWTDADRAGELLELYNRKYNNIAPRRFDGSHLTLPGLSTRRKLHAHQKRAIWRIIQDGNTYLAHAVGAGKTLMMICAGMEMKRLGLISKPMYVVPNDQLAQWAAGFLDAYPLANIMIADEENFHTSNRRRFMAQAAMNNPDAIIITQSSLGKLRLKKENVEPVKQELLADLRISLEDAKDEGAGRWLLSKMEGMIEKAEQRFDSVVDDGKGDNVLTFEDLGVDFLIVDEAHTYRKLDYTTVQQVKGIDPVGSRRALDLFLKVKYLSLKRPGRSHVFASGTPVTNTMGELYNVMRFFMEEQMERDDIKHFDAWSAQFGETAIDYELNAAGRYEPVTRFAKFNNLPELMSRVRTFMDVLTGNSLGAYVKRPDVKGGGPRQIIAPASDALKSYQKTVLQPRMTASKNWKPSRQQPGNPDPIINIITDGRLASIDMRFVDPKAPNDPNSKLNMVIDDIIRIYKLTKKRSYNTRDGNPSPIKGAAQVVFYNHGFGNAVARTRGFDGRAWINKRLKAAGIPLTEVAWFDEYDTGAKKLAVQKDVREGRKKIIIGHARALGVGKNLQTRLYGLHYIDPPWYPADVEQPHGRIIRQGNQNEEVEINWYATKGSYDSTMWQMVGRKGRFIEQAFAGDNTLRSMEDLSEVSQYEMARAMSSGDERIIKLVGLQAEVERLQRLLEAHFRAQSNMRADRSSQQWYLKTYKEHLQQTKEAEAKIGYITTRNFTGEIAGKKYTDTGEFGEAVIKAFNAAVGTLDPGKLKGDRNEIVKQYGTINGMPLVAVLKKSWGEPQGVNRVDVTEHVKVEVDENLMMYPEATDEAGLTRRIISRLDGVGRRKYELESRISEAEEKLAVYQKKIGAPYEYQEQLNEKVAELAQLQAELTAEDGKAPDTSAVVIPVPEIPEEVYEPSKLKWNELAGSDKDNTPSSRFIYQDTDGDGAFSNGHYAIVGELPDKLAAQLQKPVRPFSFAQTLGRAEVKDPVAYVGQTQDGDRRLVWLSNGLPLDARYYDLVLTLHPGAQFRDTQDPKGKNGPAQGLVAFVDDTAVAIVMPVNDTAPAEIQEKIDQRQAQSDQPMMMAGQGSVGVALTDEEFDAIFRRITARLKNTDGFVVAPTARDLPARIVAEIQKQGGDPNEIDGVFHNGKVYLVREHMTSASMLEEVIFHEWHGHAGLVAMFGNDKAKLQKAMLELYGMFKPGELLSLAKKYDFKLTKYAKGLREAGYSDDQRHATLMEEMLSFMTREYSRGGIANKVREIIGMIRDWLRRHGFVRLSDRSEADIAFLLKKARAYADLGSWVKDGPTVAVDGAAILARLQEMGVTDEMLMQFMSGVPRFAAAWHGSPKRGIEKFDKAFIGTGEGAQAFGYGHYFTTSKEVAEYYRKKLAGNPDSIPVHRLIEKIIPERVFTPLEAAHIFHGILQKDVDGKILRHRHASLRDVDAAKLDQVISAALEYASGGLYQVELAPAEDEYLRWDLPLSKQSEKVKAAFNEAAENADMTTAESRSVYGFVHNKPWKDFAEKTGQDIYRELSGVMQSRQAASEYLQSLGVRGIKYPAETLTTNKQGDGTAFNYVVFDDADIEITALFHLRDTAERISPAGALDKIKGLLNPLDYSRLRRSAEKRLSGKAKHAIGFILQTPYWKQSEADPAAAPFYKEGRIREEERHTFNIRMRGGLAEGEQAPVSLKQKVKDVFSWSDEHTAWEALKRQVYYPLTNDERAALDLLVVEGDARQVEYGSLGRARLNPVLRAAGVNQKVFTAYQALMAAKDKAFDVALDIEQEVMIEAGVPKEKVESSIADKRAMNKAVVAFDVAEAADALTVTLPRAQASVNVVHQLRKIAQSYGTTVAKQQGGDHVAIFRPEDAEQVREALTHVLANRIRGHMHRDHGEGEHVVAVHQLVDSLDFEEREITTKSGKPAVQMFLPYYPGRDLAEQIEAVVGDVVGSFLQLDGKGEILLTVRKDDADQARGALAKLTDNKKPRRVMVYSRYVGTEHEADQLKAEVSRDLAKAIPINYRAAAKYEVTAQLSNSIQEKEFQAAVTGSYALDRITEQTLRKSVIKGDISEQDSAALLDSYREELANTLLARGAGAMMIRRAPYLIEGYERGNVMGNFERTIDGTAGMLSKALYALRQYKNLRTVPAKTRRWAVGYVETTLRNMGRADRISGDVRALASLWYLGGNLTWMLINHTQPYVFGVAELSRHISDGKLLTKEQGAMRRILGAEKDILTGKLTAAETRLFDDRRVKVQIEETVMAELAGSDAGVGGKVSKGIHMAARVTMAHGHKVEVLNRKIMILAAYRTFVAQGLDTGKALGMALEVNSATNIDMGRYNLPGFAGKYAIGRGLYALQSFVQHAWNWLYYRTTSGKRADQKAVLRLLFAMALLGGLPAGAPGSDELDKLIMRLFGYSPKLALKGFTRKFAREHDTAGELLEDFVWRGIPGTVGVSLTGAVQFRLPVVTAVLDGDTSFRALGGAVGGLVEKGRRGTEAMSRGDYYRALENVSPTVLANVMSAYRQSTEGVRTAGGKPTFYQGQPLRLSPGDAAKRAVGLQPVRAADISETRGFEIDLQAQWNERRRQALDRYRITRKLRYVQDFNKALRSSQAFELVTPITPDTLREVNKPNKRQTIFQLRKGPD